MHGFLKTLNMKLKSNIAIAAGIAMLALASCKKEKVATIANTKEVNVQTKTISATSTALNIDRYGFLVFSTTEDLDKYVDYLKSHALAQVIAFHKNKGFKSQAGNKYDNADQTKLITDEQIMDFILDANGLAEIEGTVFRLTDDQLYLLTIQKQILDDQTFTAIADAAFDATIMNQFAINKERDESFNLFATISGNQSGINEGQIMYPGGGQSNLMKFWGKTESAGPCDETGYQLVTVTHWMFWIKAGYDWYYRPCVN